MPLFFLEFRKTALVDRLEKSAIADESHYRVTRQSVILNNRRSHVGFSCALIDRCLRAFEEEESF